MDIESDAVVADQWDPLTKKKDGGGGKGRFDGEVSLFMDLKPREEPYRVRFICTPVPFRKHFQAFRSLHEFPISPANEPSQKDLDVAWSKGDYYPRERFMALVLDREYDGMIRIIEGGAQIFRVLGEYTKMAKKNPAGPSGPDFLISVTKDDQVSYSVMPAPEGPAPFSADEIERMNGSKLNRQWMIDRLVEQKRATPEEIQALYDRLPADLKVNPEQKKSKFAKKGAPTQQTARQPVQQPAPQPAAQPAQQPTQAAQPAEPVEPPEEVDDGPQDGDGGEEEQQPAELF